MSINIGDNLSYLGAKPLDGRLKYDTVSAMAGMSDNVLYDGCLAYCVGSDKTYQWKSTNTVDPTTGKWREFTSGGGTAEDPIEYVNELPTSGIEDKIYGIRVTSGITKTIQLIKPIAGQLSKEEATAYFSQFFTVTEQSSTRLSLSVYPDLVLSRDGWGQDYKAVDGDIVTLSYLVDTQELSWTNSSSQETSTAAWSVSPISCTSAYFPTYKYYAGVEDTQELNEIGAGGSADIDNHTIIKNQQEEICINEEINPSEFTGTMAEWVALPTATKALYQRLNTTDDDGGAVEVSNEAILGDMKPITSNGAAKLLCCPQSNPYNDCNNIIKVGTYTISPAISNRPSNTDYGVLMVFGHNTNTASSSSQWIYQYFYETAGVGGIPGRVYRRACVNPNSLTPTSAQWMNWELISGVEQISNPFTVNSTTVTNAGEIVAMKQSRVVQFKVYLDVLKNVTTGSWITLGTVVDSIKPAMETVLTISDGSTVMRTALARITTNGEVQIWGNQELNSMSSRFSATYFSAS